MNSSTKIVATAGHAVPGVLRTAASAESDSSTEMSRRRTGMSFQRTRMSADRTLMSVIRTSLSLISFGFTIFQVFEKLEKGDVLRNAHAPRNFGMALVSLGIIMLAIGIVYHVQFMLGLRKTRMEMASEGLIHGESVFPHSFALVVAVLLFFTGVGAMASMVLQVGPFG
jgi:putative membrane protein